MSRDGSWTPSYSHLGATAGLHTKEQIVACSAPTGNRPDTRVAVAVALTVPTATWGLKGNWSHPHNGVSQPWVTQEQPPSGCDTIRPILKLLWFQLITILQAKTTENRQVTNAVF